MFLLFILIFMSISPVIWYCLRGKIEYILLFFPPRKFFQLCPTTHWMLALHSLPVCSWELWACTGLAWLPSGHRWVSVPSVYTVLFHLVKKSVGHHKDFWLLLFIGPLVSNLQRGIYYPAKPHEFNSVPALLIFRPAHSIIRLYCWLRSVSTCDLLGDRRLIFIVFGQRVLRVFIVPWLPSFHTWQVNDLNPLMIEPVNYHVTLWAKCKALVGERHVSEHR